MIVRNRIKLNLYRSSLCFLTLLLMCCSSALTKYTRSGTDNGKINRIAVLPIENFTSDEYADEKIRSLVIIDLLSRDLDVIEPGEVIKTLRELRVWSMNALSAADIQNIGKVLKVDAVMTGSVSAFGIKKGISVSYPEVSVSLMLHEASSGNVIWSVWNTTGGASFWTRHFGLEGVTLDETSREVIEKAIDTLF